MRSLRTWLALGLVLALAAPVAAGAGAWLAAASWQTHKQDARLAAVKRLLLNATIDTPRLGQRLSRLGVEAMLQPVVDKRKLAALMQAKLGAGKKPALSDQAAVDKAQMDQQSVTTPGLRAVFQTDGKDKVGKDYVATNVELPQLTGTLYVRRESIAARWAIALAAAVIALAAALTLAVSLLRRWVLRPLAALAADAERIAGGELAVMPIDTRAREVAQVGDALQGMAGALEHALGASTAAERDRRFLVTAIAHDLRTPLFTLRGSLEAIERGIGDGAALSRAQAKAAHLDRLVGDLFAYARAEYANGAHAPEPLDLAEIARRAAETVEPGAVALDVVTNGPVHLEGDPVALQRVLTNLLDNAIRHARARVELVVTGARVEVADDGPGFAPADLPHVFEPLFRGDRARATATGGAGLGLAIARHLVHAHGGEIEASNRPQGGARVTVTLP